MRGRWKGPFTRLNKEEFKKDYLSGMQIKKMAEKYNVNWVSIRNWAKSLDLNRPRMRPDLAKMNHETKRYVGKDNPAFGYRKLNWLSRGALKKLYHMYGRNYALVAKAIGVNPGTVRKAVFEIGLKEKNSGHRTQETIYVENIKQRAYNSHYFFRWDERVQDAVRLRDGKCMLCGKMSDKKSLAVHHIFYDLRFSDEEHLIALCGCCHCKTNYNREKWIPIFTEMLSSAYGYVYDEWLGAGGECILARTMQ
jgi:hypothetical protein